VLGGKAEILAEGEPIRSASRSWTAPSVVRLRHRVRRPRPRAKLSRKEIFARDKHACQYCGRAGVSLTIDHVVPKSRGGDSWSWENLVTACMSCNHRKGDRLPEAAGLQLRRRPYEPRCDVYAIFLPYLRHDAYSAWRDFLFIGEGVTASGA
jgi:5-methylcytosine-specific restriction endonuclease McrA